MTSDVVLTVGGVRLLRCAAVGPRLASGQDAADLIGQAYGHQVDLVVVPVGRLDERFFTLRTGVAGEIVQKFVNYGLRLAVQGDIAPYLATSASLRDFVREANAGRSTWFVVDEGELDARLKADGRRPA